MQHLMFTFNIEFVAITINQWGKTISKETDTFSEPNNLQLSGKGLDNREKSTLLALTESSLFVLGILEGQNYWINFREVALPFSRMGRKTLHMKGCLC